MTQPPMSQAVTPEARFDAMTDQEKVEWLATEVMGWQMANDVGGDDDTVVLYFTRGRNDTVHIHAKNWNPLTDWNHWRQVEEKVSENSELLCEYIDTLICRTELGNCTVRLVLEDLPTRAKALYIACPSPHANS